MQINNINNSTYNSPNFKGLSKVLSNRIIINPDYYEQLNKVYTREKGSVGSLPKDMFLLFKRKSGAENAEKILQEKLNLAPVIGNSFENIRLLDKKDIYAKAYIDEGGFDSTDTQLQSVEMDDQLSLTPEFPYNWMYDGTKNTLNRVKAYFELEMECRALLLVFKDSGEVNVGKAKVYVDGEYHFTADPHINNWQHCNAVIIFNNKTSENHVVRIEIAEEDRDKQFTILGFGYVL